VHVKLDSAWTSALEEGEWSASRFGRLYAPSHPYAVDMGFSGPQFQYDHSGVEEKEVPPVSKIEPRKFRLEPVTLATKLYWLTNEA